MLRNTQRGGVVGNVLTLILVVVGVYVIYINLGDERVAKAKQRQATPDAALMYYLQQAYGFMTGDQNVIFDDVKLAVTKEDWDWYSANYSKLHFDAFNLGSAIDPNAAEALARRDALRGLLSVGPNRTDTQILSQTTSGNVAVFHLKYLGPIPNRFKESNVELVQENGLWKVKDFAGGRQAATIQ